MVRVNLLPERRQTKVRGVPRAAEPGQLWVLVVLGLIVLEVVALLFVEKFKQDELADITVKNKTIQNQIAEIQRETADAPQIKQRLKDLRDREEAAKKLEAGRIGPTSVLMELAKILTTGNEPTAPRERLERVKAENPMTAVHLEWDAHRLWLTSYQEIDRVVKMSGFAREIEDVSEFERRLHLSDYFFDVKLLPGGKVNDANSKQDLQKFEISAKVRY